MTVPMLAAEAQGLGALGINLKALIFELVNFGILFWILRRYAYGPVVKMIENRRTFIEDSLKQAESARTERDKVVGERTEILEKARKQAAAIVSDARAEAETQKADILDEAKGSAEHIIEQAKRDTDRRLSEARTELAREAITLVTAATAELIDDKLDTPADAKLVERALETAGARRG